MKGISQSRPVGDTDGLRAAIYCRVSTEDQEREGTSLETQRQACSLYCQEKGYLPIQQFIETASGLTLDRPELSELRALVRARAINKIVIYCLDRLSRDPTHGVILTQEFEKYEVNLESVSEDVDNSELGKLINYIRGFAAKLEAEKIQERTTRGTRSRVLVKKLPVTYSEPYGYSWDRNNNILVPNKDYDLAKLIINLALGGKSYLSIIAELKMRGIPSPTGLPDWNSHTIGGIIHNPVYAGKYYAFKSRVRVPNRRKVSRYGKTSTERLTPDQWIYVPEIVVMHPILTVSQQAYLLDQLAKRQSISRRNAKRDYLLSGLIHCETHRGKKGEARIYCGQSHYESYRYFCPVGKCQAGFIDGPELENMVVVQTAFFLSEIDKSHWALTESQTKETSETLESDIKKLQKESDFLIGKMAKLEDSRLEGEVDDSVYKQLKTQYDKRRHFLAGEQNKLLDSLKQINDARTVSESMKSLTHKWTKELAQNLRAFTDCDSTDKPATAIAFWRQLLIGINFELRIHPLSATDPYLEHYIIKKKEINCEIRYTLPLDIVLPCPGAV